MKSLLILFGILKVLSFKYFYTQAPFFNSGFKWISLNNIYLLINNIIAQYK